MKRSGIDGPLPHHPGRGRGLGVGIQERCTCVGRAAITWQRGRRSWAQSTTVRRLLQDRVQRSGLVVAWPKRPVGRLAHGVAGGAVDHAANHAAGERHELDQVHDAALAELGQQSETDLLAYSGPSGSPIELTRFAGPGHTPTRPGGLHPAAP